MRDDYIPSDIPIREATSKEAFVSRRTFVVSAAATIGVIAGLAVSVVILLPVLLREPPQEPPVEPPPAIVSLDTKQPASLDPEATGGLLDDPPWDPAPVIQHDTPVLRPVVKRKARIRNISHRR